MKVDFQNHLRSRVYDMLGRLPKKEVLAHFLHENISRSTIYSIFKRYEEGQDAIGVKKSGRPKILTPAALKKLRNSAIGKRGKSNRVLSRQHHTINTINVL